MSHKIPILLYESVAKRYTLYLPFPIHPIQSKTNVKHPTENSKLSDHFLSNKITNGCNSGWYGVDRWGANVRTGVVCGEDKGWLLLYRNRFAKLPGVPFMFNKYPPPTNCNMLYHSPLSAKVL